MERRTWDYKVASVVRVVDGDTFDLTLEKEIDFGFYLRETKRWTHRFRLLGADAPERREPGFLESKTFAENWLKDALYFGLLRAQTFKTDSFGRWLADPYRTDTGATLANALKAAGHAV